MARHPRPSAQARLRLRLEAWLRATGRLPSQADHAEGRLLALDLRRTHRRGILDAGTLALLRAAGADGAWLAPYRSAWLANLGELTGFVADHGRLPTQREKRDGAAVGRWLSRQRVSRLSSGQVEALSLLGVPASSPSS